MIFSERSDLGSSAAWRAGGDFDDHSSSPASADVVARPAIKKSHGADMSTRNVVVVLISSRLRTSVGGVRIGRTRVSRSGIWSLQSCRLVGS